MTVKEKLEWPHGSCFYLTKKLVVFFCLLCGIIKCFQSPLTFNVARWLLQKVAADCTLHSGVLFFVLILLKKKSFFEILPAKKLPSISYKTTFRI